MPKTKKKTPVKRPVTRRQLSKWQRQNKIKRIIMIVAGIFLAAVVGGVGYAYYAEEIKPSRDVVLEVDDTSFDLRYLQDSVRLYANSVNTEQQQVLPDLAINRIIQNELVIRGAAELGYTISSKQIDDEMDGSNMPDNKSSRDDLEAQLVSLELLEKYFDPMFVTSDDQVKLQAMFLETEEKAREIIEKLNNDDDFSSLAEEFSVEPYTKADRGNLGWLPKTIDILPESLGGSVLKDAAFKLEPGSLSEPIFDSVVTKPYGFWLLEVLARDEDRSIHVQGILLGTDQEANEVKARIESGEDFAALAEELSLDPESAPYGGDLGWIQETFQYPAVWKAVLVMDPGIVSNPIRDDNVETGGGYWVIKVTEKETDRDLDDNLRMALKSEAFEIWVAGRRINSSIEILLTDEQRFMLLDLLYQTN